ncbi:MAG: hypothetical protein JJU45_03320 [Acidimicrobiia bacterium]|nr:hypothetical protein [Acidimicrobiia bacterium]
MGVALRYRAPRPRGMRLFVLVTFPVLVVLWLLTEDLSAWQTWVFAGVIVLAMAMVERDARLVMGTVELCGNELTFLSDTGNRRSTEVGQVTAVHVVMSVVTVRFGDGTKLHVRYGPALAALVRALEERNPGIEVRGLAQLERAERAQQRRVRFGQWLPWIRPLGIGALVTGSCLLVVAFVLDVPHPRVVAERAVSVKASVAGTTPTDAGSVDVTVRYELEGAVHRAVVPMAAEQVALDMTVELAVDPSSPEVAWLPGEPPPSIHPAFLPLAAVATVLLLVAVYLLPAAFARPPTLETVPAGD